MSVICKSWASIRPIMESLISPYPVAGRYKACDIAMPCSEEAKMDQYQLRAPKKNLDRERETALNIACWVERLWVANQAAYYYQYRDEKGALEFAPDDYDPPRGTVPMEAGKLYRELQSLQYNLYTNDGHTFCSEEDMRRLEEVMRIIAASFVDAALEKRGEF